MARKQNKKSHSTNNSGPADKVPTSTNANDSSGSHIETETFPDKHRRTSVLITGGDEALPHNKPVDDAISSMAKMSASFTDDKILRKSLGVEEKEIGEKLKILEKEPEHEPSEVVIGNDDDVKGDVKDDVKDDVEDDTIAPNQFEEAIKKNKLDPQDQTAAGNNGRGQPDLSPRTTTGIVEPLSRENKDTDGHDSAADVSGLASKDDDNKNMDHDPITLVGDKRKSELQEYIPETGAAKEETDDFAPAQKDLTSTDKEGKDQAPELSDASEAKNDSFPWGAETLTDANLPWETEDTNYNKSAAPMPWELESYDEASKNDDNLPWESHTNDAPSQADDDNLPWESDTNNDAHASQEDDENKESNESTNVDDLFGGGHDNDFLKEIQKQEESKDKDEVLLDSSENTPSAQPSSQGQDISQDMRKYSTTQTDISHCAEKDKLALQSENDPKGENEKTAENLDIHRPQEADHLDELFQDDDHDFLQEVGSSDKKTDPFKFPPDNSALDSKDSEKSETQNKSLDFLEMDNDLLDDEFLEDDITSQTQTLKSKSNKQAYSPSTTRPSTTTVVPTQEKLKGSTVNKKKNDAYDFPDSLISHKFKPAARSTNKYAPGSSSHNSPPVASMPPKLHSPSMNAVGSMSVSNEKQAISTQGLQKKSFFEDLPMPIQKQLVKPARAALPRSQMSQSISPTVNPAQPQLQKPVVNPYARPAMNTVVSPPMNYAQPSGMPPVTNNRGGSHIPVGMVAPPPPSQITGNNVLPHVQPQAFPNMQNQNLGQNTNSYAPSRKISNPSPNLINTALPKVQGAQSATSPYVPNAGPYAPSSHKRTLSRASSLIGAKSKEVNPYAPASINVPNAQQGISQGIMKPNTASPTAPPAAMNNSIHGRRRGVSNVKSNFYHKEQTAPKVENPNALLQRQFPIFNWSSSKSVAYLIPSAVTNTYNRTSESVNVTDIKYVLKDSHYLSTFPGPFNKLKTKKKDVEKWLESYNEFLIQDNTGMKQDEVLVSQILLALVRFNGDCKSDDFTKAACAVLNPSVDYVNDNTHMDMNSTSALANAYRLDNAGINIIWSLLQIGNTEKALEFCLSKGDWALALMIASFDGLEKFGKVASDYARTNFPFQKSQSKVHHLMPIMLKLFAGNFKSAIDDITNVQTEGEWFIQNWRELVSLVVINKPQHGHEFLCEFSKLLALSGQIIASQICLILAGLPLSSIPSQTNGILFSVIGFGSHSFAYSEIYEYAMQLSTTNIPPTGFAHLLPLKLKHAQVLADYGLFTESQKYCDAISNIIKATGRSSFFNPVAFQEFQNLLMRISQSGASDLGWFGSKKLNLDKMWDQLDKFIGGDESKAKSGENGTFSKFSPAVSRAPSSLDITSLNNHYPQTLPQVRPDHIRDTLVATNSAPGTSSENSILKLNGMPHSRPPPSLYSNNSTTSIQKYAPSSSQVTPKPTLTRNDQLFSSQQVGNPVYESLQQSRMAPNNSSSQYLPMNQGQSENIKASSKYSTNPQKVYSNNNGSLPYMNPSAQFSSLSIASHQSLHMGISGVNANPSTSVKRPSISNSFSENHVNSNPISGHKHTSSLQSDISLDYPAEFKSMPKPAGDNSIIPDAHLSLKRDNENVPETITESRESEKSSELRDSSNSLTVPLAIDEGHSTVEDLTLPQAPPPKGHSKPNIASSSVAPKKARARANPYAPGAAASRTGGNNKYGPQSSDKYTSKKENTSLLVDTPSDISYNDIFNYGGYKVPEKSEVNDSKDLDDRNEVNEAPDQESIDTKEGASKTSSYLYPEPPKVISMSQSRNINVDESFDSENINDHDFETSSLNAPNAKVPASNNLNNSFRTNEKESMFHPYQESENKSRRTSNFGVDSSFGDFPIPGSPDLTTRANSVIGGPGGLFSSRLSQSQQSALYQQYEVQDDTVKEYIPVVDEEDEDSEDESLKIEKRKKEEQERHARIEADRTKQRQDAAASQRNQTWWPGFLARKNDDKPKAIRAKLGEKNKFVYDEKLKRWIDKSIPLEEQLKSSAPPPPPAAKKKPIDGSSSSISKPSNSSTPLGPAKQDMVPPTSNPLNGTPLLGPSQPRPSQSGPPPPAGPSLANAGLDDLLSLGGGPSSGRKSKKGPRRGYVNLLDQSK
ncbi:unnamed protein product [Debaryomyces tyrocola]|nr:unnamed protein product [Debaryomyces tyrocola]